MTTITHELDKLNGDLAEYQRLSKKTVEETLAKQGGKLGLVLRRELRGLSPVKGAIRAESLARLHGGQGIHVRASVRQRIFAKYGAAQKIKTRGFIFGRTGKATRRSRGRRLNLQALAVQAEINARESGRGFLSISSTQPRFARNLSGVQRAFSRYGPLLSQAALTVIPNRSRLEFTWGGFSELSGEAAKGLSQPKSEAAIARALALTSSDIQLYLDRKLSESATQSFTKTH